MNDHKKKSQSTTNIDRDSTKQGSLYNLSNKSNRTKSQSPSRANGKNSPSEQQKQQAEVQHSTEKKKNGLIKRLSLRFKSHSVDHADDNHADNKKKSKKQAQTDNKEQQPPESDAKSKRNSKNKEMDSYAEMYNNYINAEKTKSNSSLGKPPSSSTNANRSRNEYEISERKIYGSSYSNYRHDANKRASSSPIDDPNHRDYKIIKVKLENQPKQRSLVSEDDINIQGKFRRVENIERLIN
jgi:hypothetical protein